MFPQHCNKCYRQKVLNLTLQFYMSNCGHIVCKKCQGSTCPVCQRPVKTFIIAKGMPPSMASYLEHPLKLYKHAQKVTRYHRDQSLHLMKYQLNVLPLQLQKTLQQRNAIVKLEARLAADWESEKQRISKLKAYLSYYMRRMKQDTTSAPRSSSQRGRRHSKDSGYHGYASVSNSSATNSDNVKSDRYCPCTPTLSLPDSSSDNTSRGDKCNSTLTFNL